MSNVQTNDILFALVVVFSVIGYFSSLNAMKDVQEVDQ